MLAARDDAPDARAVPRRAAASRAREQIERAARRCSSAAERPLAILGGAGWTPRAAQDLRAFLEANALPAGAAFRRQDAIDNDSPSYVGDVGIGINPKLAARVREADLLLAVGPRLGEMTTSGYTLSSRRRRADARARPPGRRGARARLPARRCRSSRGWSSSRRPCATLRVEPRWREWTARGARRLRGVAAATSRCPATLDLGECIAHLRERVPDAIVTNGAGNFTRLGAPLLALPRLPDAARADERRDGLRRAGRGRREGSSRPERTVICFAGDGDFLMSGQELATAVQYELPIVVLVVEQRHVRDDPHAPGAPLSGPRRRHRSRQSRLRRVRARLRRARRDGRPRRRSSRPRSSARSPRAGRRCSSCGSTPRRSRRARR